MNFEYTTKMNHGDYCEISVCVDEKKKKKRTVWLVEGDTKLQRQQPACTTHYINREKTFNTRENKTWESSLK